MSEPELPDITRMLEKVTSGDAHAAHELLPLVYEQLRAAAQKQMAQERGDHTLQATACYPLIRPTGISIRRVTLKSIYAAARW